MLQNRTNS